MKWASDKGFRIASIALTAFNVVGLVACATTMQQVRLRFAAIYGELLEGGLVLPPATQFVLTVPAWAASAVFLTSREYVIDTWRGGRDVGLAECAGGRRLCGP
ncbi:MAG: hypothetical protein BWK77_01635 [Verrucomicrobia bacterium A1]|nr:MAG: hypothetical protein BWK77_01635 [Verrucomicrobia bacterium A1]